MAKVWEQLRSALPISHQATGNILRARRHSRQRQLELALKRHALLLKKFINNIRA